MIGWTKKRKRCPEHGLLLGKEPGDWQNRANYCPACGKKLMVVGIPYLFKIYFHPAIMIVPGILAFIFGLFIVLDVRGCVIADRKVEAIARKVEAIAQVAMEASHKKLVQNLPEDWKILYPAVYEAKKDWQMNAWIVLRDFLGRLEEGKKMSRLTPEEIQMFMQLMPSATGDNAFELMTIHMGEER